jgi:hypothetical protein
MTNKPELFSSPIVPDRRAIKVGGGMLWSTRRGTTQCKLRNSRSVFLKDTLLVPQLGCNLLSARKLVSNNQLIGKFNKERMVFCPPDDMPIIEAKRSRGVFIVSAIAKKADGATFGETLLPSRTSLNLPSRSAQYPNSMVLPVRTATPVKSALRKDTAYPAEDLPVTTLPKTDDEFEVIVQRNTRVNRSPLRSTDPVIVKTANKFTALDVENSLTVTDEEQPYAKISDKRGIYPQITKSQRNAVVRSIRKEERSNKPSEERLAKRSPWTLKQRKDQRVIDRYVYYHRTYCHANPHAISLLHTVTNIKRVVIPDKIPLCEVCARSKMRKVHSKQLAEHKNEPLALVSFDVAGPFPTSYRGYKYFGVLLDNWSRKE